MYRGVPVIPVVLRGNRLVVSVVFLGLAQEVGQSCGVHRFLTLVRASGL
jgi:hypothetical protein